MTKRTIPAQAVLVAAVFLMMVRAAGATAPKVKMPKEKKLVLDLLAARKKRCWRWMRPKSLLLSWRKRT